MEEIPLAMTLPPELEFRPSSMETMQIGVWSKCAIKKDEIYGPFLGEKKKLSDVLDDTYSWEIRGPKGRRLFSIDASDPSTGNWMRYVKSARFYEEQNMMAVQEDKNIFYKTLRKIPKDEELLCWFTGLPNHDRKNRMKQTPSLPSKSKFKDTHIARCDNENAAGHCQDADNDTNKTDETCKTDGIISLAAHDDDVKMESKADVQRACISFSGLNDSIRKMMSSEQHGNDSRGKGPVVKLIPLSAEIKLKVHLDLDIHLDSDLKAKDILSPGEGFKSPKTSVCENVKAQFDERCKISFHQSTETDSTMISQTKIESVTKPDEDLPKPSAICMMLQSGKEEIKEEFPDMFSGSQENMSSDEKTNYDSHNFETKEGLMSEACDSLENHKVNEVKVLKSEDNVFEERNVLNYQGEEVPACVKDEMSCSANVKSEPSYTGVNVKEEVPCLVSNEKGKSSCLSANSKISRLDETVEKKAVDVTRRHAIVEKDASQKKEGDRISGNGNEEENKDMSQIREESSTILEDIKKDKITHKKVKKSQYRCHICNRGFRKPFHLKMHIIKAHEKRERKVKEYIVRKPEKIRTRSVSYSEKATARSFQIPKKVSNASPGVRNFQVKGNLNQGGTVAYSRQLANTNMIQRQYQKILPKPSHHPSSSISRRSQNEMHYGEAESILHRCCECKRTFKYKSWLRRHMVIHQQTTRTNDYQMTPEVHSSSDFSRGTYQYENISDIKQEIDDMDIDGESYIMGNLVDADSLSAKIKESSLKQFACSLCGKHFTTKKNARRHKRLIHNILVRPERTKLPYFNYTVEKPNSTFKRAKGIRLSGKQMSKCETMSKIQKPKFNRRRSGSYKLGERRSPSSDISVRLFDPSKLTVSDTRSSIRNLKKKIEWGTSSDRTGPPPAAAGLRNRDLYRQMLQQEALFTSKSPVPNPWTLTRKPNPFVPKNPMGKSGSKASPNLLEEASSRRDRPVMIPRKRVRDIASNIPATDMSVNLPIDLSSRKRLQTHVTNVGKSLVNNGAFILSDETVMQSENSDYARRSVVHTKQQMDIKQSQLKRICDQNSGNAIKHSKDGQLLPTSGQYESMQTREDSFEKSNKYFASTSRSVQETERASPMLKPSQLQKQMVSILKPILPKLEPIDMQSQRPSEEKKPAQVKMEIDKKDPLREFICNVCCQPFLTVQQLKQHVAHHADDWPYKCEFCIQLFQKPIELMLHRSNHHGGKAFSCRTCKCKFVDEKFFKEHQMSAHGTKKKKTEPRQDMTKKCDVFGVEQTAKMEQMTSVMQVHSTLATYRCTKCSKQFTETSDFHSHIIDCALTDTDK